MMVLSLALTLPYQKIPTVMGRLIFDSRMSGSGRTCTCKRTSKKLCLRGQRQNQKSRGISLALIIRKRKKKQKCDWQKRCKKEKLKQRRKHRGKQTGPVTSKRASRRFRKSESYRLCEGYFTFRFTALP